VAEIRVSYFLEDALQESFIPALVERVAAELSLSSNALIHNVRNATGGKGVVKTELRKFLRDVQREKEPAPDVLIVAIDSNCQGYTEKRNEIESLAQRAGYKRPLVCAVPDPHIERWYLEDTAALRQVLQSQVTPQTPTYKCERDRYKQALGQAFADASLFPIFGGSEYGEEIAQSLDFYTVEKADAAFKHFVDSLKQALAPFCPQTG
jgi:hypothetical protein